jgi:hypothetical protein
VWLHEVEEQRRYRRLVVFPMCRRQPGTVAVAVAATVLVVPVAAVARSSWYQARFWSVRCVVVTAVCVFSSSSDLACPLEFPFFFFSSQVKFSSSKS